MKQLSRCCAVLVLAALVFGCTGRPREETIQVKAANDPLNEARSILERYAAGQELGSEVASFPNLVQRVTTANAENGRTLEAGLADIQRNPANREALAKDLLKKLPAAAK